MKRWVVGNVRTGEEFPIAERMEEIGVKTYCPVAVRRCRPARKRRPIDIECAAFPGYLFMKAETIDDPERVYQDSGFHYFITNELQEIVTLTSDIIDEIRSREALGAFQARFVSGPMFAIGETVKVSDGPWKSLRGKVTGMRRGRYELDGLDFPRPVWFSGLTLLGKSV